MISYIDNIITESQEKANLIFGKKLNKPIKSALNTRMFNAFGRWTFSFKTQSHTIEIAQKVFKSITPELKDTIIHEYAHAYAYEHYNDKGHGYYWKMVFKALGGSGERLVSKEKANAIGYVRAEHKNTMTKYIYSCGCKEFKISPQKHNKILKGIHFRCNACGNRIHFTDKVIKV